MTSGVCPCGSGCNYDECCERLHRGEISAETAEKLMRARFSAYAHNQADYIIKTTHPASPHYTENFSTWKRSLNEFSKGTEFLKLEIVDFSAEGDLATVTFIAFLTQGGQDATFTEKSYFQKAKGEWLYLRGHGERGEVRELASQYPSQHFPLAYYGDPILLKPAEPIIVIDDEIKELAGKMIEAMRSFPGLGLAAPQIKRSLRLFVAQPPVEVAPGKLERGQVEVFINPKLTMPSDETWVEEEGCLSIPTLRGSVRRPLEVTIEYQNLQGEHIKRQLSGWEARVIMHEYDHIEGILFTDRLEKKERYAFEPRLRTLKQRLS